MVITVGTAARCARSCAEPLVDPGDALLLPAHRPLRPPPAVGERLHRCGYRRGRSTNGGLTAAVGAREAVSPTWRARRLRAAGERCPPRSHPRRRLSLRPTPRGAAARTGRPRTKACCYGMECAHNRAHFTRGDGGVANCLADGVDALSGSREQRNVAVTGGNTRTPRPRTKSASAGDPADDPEFADTLPTRRRAAGPVHAGAKISADQLRAGRAVDPGPSTTGPPKDPIYKAAHGNTEPCARWRHGETLDNLKESSYEPDDSDAMYDFSARPWRDRGGAAAGGDVVSLWPLPASVMVLGPAAGRHDASPSVWGARRTSGRLRRQRDEPRQLAGGRRGPRKALRLALRAVNAAAATAQRPRPSGETYFESGRRPALSCST